MRLFCAIRPPAEALDHLSAALGSVLRPSLGRRSPLQPRGNWHITLAFYGELADGAVPQLVAELTERLGPIAPFALELRGAGRFGRGVGWIGLGGQMERFNQARTAALTAGQSCSVDPPAAPDTRHPASHPHLTITRSAGRPALADALQAMACYLGPSWLVRQAVLVRSELGGGPGGHALYEPMATIPLAGPRPEGGAEHRNPYNS
ncbi:MAG: 2'-5' RNA ligase family protein [Bifidobacteriaceae bacterium]|nr:2'-5' RNA ligase family protein [Bifidobacteriaceae bacterium]